jgi:hypothetical protein
MEIEIPHQKNKTQKPEMDNTKKTIPRMNTSTSTHTDPDTRDTVC